MIVRSLAGWRSRALSAGLTPRRSVPRSPSATTPTKTEAVGPRARPTGQATHRDRRSSRRDPGRPAARSRPPGRGRASRRSARRASEGRPIERDADAPRCAKKDASATSDAIPSHAHPTRGAQKRRFGRRARPSQEPRKPCLEASFGLDPTDPQNPQNPLAMQKVEGSSPFIRSLGKPRRSGALVVLGRIEIEPLAIPGRSRSLTDGRPSRMLAPVPHAARGRGHRRPQ